MSNRLIKLALFVSVATVCMSTVAGAATIDWTLPIDSVKVNGVTAYPGCSKSKSINDPLALKMAIFKAQANIAHTQRVVVSGQEKVKVTNGSSDYVLTVNETSEAHLGTVKVIERELTEIDDITNLCVLVIEE